MRVHCVPDLPEPIPPPKSRPKPERNQPNRKELLQMLSLAKTIIASLCLKIPDSDYCGAMKFLQEYREMVERGGG